MKKIRIIILLMLCIFTLGNVRLTAKATSESDYVTITVDGKDANTTYALDTDDPNAFKNSNEFKVPAGTTHTVYIKDAAGNITSQMYTPTSTETDGEKEVNIDFEVGGENDTNTKGGFSNYSYLTDSPLDLGTGTVRNKTTTNGSDTADKVFYTIQTEEGATFYMVIDQGAGDNNVYFLNAVTLDDLKALAADSKNEKIQKSGNNLLSELKAGDGEDSSVEAKKKTSNNSLVYIVMLFAVIGVCIYYYRNKHKQKKNETMDAMDALDMDAFKSEEEDDEDLDFEIDEDEKQKYLDELVKGDDEENTEELMDKDPDDYLNENNKNNSNEEEDDDFKLDDDFNNKEE